MSTPPTHPARNQPIKDILLVPAANLHRAPEAVPVEVQIQHLDIKLADRRAAAADAAGIDPVDRPDV